MKMTLPARIRQLIGDFIPSGSAFILRGILRFRLLISALFLLGLFIAVAEGGTIGILAFAVSVLTDQDSDLDFSHFGWFGIYLTNIFAQFDRVQVFVGLVLGAVALQFAKSSLSYLSQYLMVRLKMRVRQLLEEMATNHVMRLDYLEITQFASGELAGKVNLTGSLSNVVSVLHTGLIALLMLLAYLGLMYLASPGLMIVSLASILILGVLLSRVINIIRRLGRSQAKATLDASRYLVEFFNSPRVLRILSFTGYAEAVIAKSREKTIRLQERQLILKAGIRPTLEMVTIFFAAIFLLGGLSFYGDDARHELPKLFLFLLAFYRAMPQFEVLNQIRASLAWAFGNWEAISEFLSPAGKRLIRTSGIEVEDFDDEIKLQAVSFSYLPTGPSVIDNLSLTIPRGTKLGVVGPSGCGKSTLADLLVGLLPPRAGRILIDGIDLNEILPSCWLRLVGMVEQDIFLLNESIRNNITFGDSRYSDDEVVRAAKLAHAHEFIMRSADGYDTVVGDRGLKISGGQRQRLALARALIRRPKVIVLDEATSALDSESERLIQETVSDLRETHTVIAIAHRLSTIKDFDRVIVLDQGRIVEDGSPETLISSGGRFADLWRAQTAQRLG